MTIRPTFAGVQWDAASNATVDAIAIGASTGGPQSLFDMFENAGPIDVPVFITQHLPVNFSAVLAARLGEIARCPCDEAEDGEIIEAGRIYFAPSDRHMLIAGTREDPFITLSDGPFEHYSRPAIDPMFRSAARVYGSSLLAIVLTGMGEDGLAGAHDVVNAGGAVIAQDRSSSTVWEMPGAVANAGIATAVLPLLHIRHGIVGAAAA